MPDIASMISTQRILCIKKYLDNYPACWKFFLNFYLKNVGDKFLFHCNFDYRKLPVAVTGSRGVQFEQVNKKKRLTSKMQSCVFVSH